MNFNHSVLVSYIYCLTFRLDWLVQASGAMYPSVYFKPTWSKQTRSGKVKSSMKVTRQWLDYAEEPHKPIYVYTSTVLGFDEGGVPDYYDDVSHIYDTYIYIYTYMYILLSHNIAYWTKHKYKILVEIWVTKAKLILCFNGRYRRHCF